MISMAKKVNLNFIDVFCGAGGLSCGLELAGLNCLLGIDFDKHAIDTFDKNHKHATNFCGDITKLHESELLELLKGQEVHVVVGGPPCQGFSTVGRGNPKDKRNSLFLQFLRVVKITKPYYVCIENVTGLLAKKNEQTLLSIFKEFSKLGYNLEAKVLESQKYGVPEKRKRTIIIGSRINEQIQFPLCTHDTLVGQSFIPALTIGEAFKKIELLGKKVKNHSKEDAQISNDLDLKRIKRIPEGRGIRYERDENEFLSKSLKLGVNWQELPENRFRQTKYHRLDSKRPGPTMMTHRHNYYHPTENRYLTVREAASIQSFPEQFEFLGSISSQWRQIGNAVPPLMAKAIGKALIQMFKQATGTKSQKMRKLSKRPQSNDIQGLRKTAFKYIDGSKQL